jgi:hypothetical protein
MAPLPSGLTHEWYWRNALPSHPFQKDEVSAMGGELAAQLVRAVHRDRSNRDVGFGRADILVTPRTPGPGAVLELKVMEPEFGDTVEGCLAQAVAQLKDRDYAAEVRAAGATEVHQYAVVFDGKRCWVRVVESSGQ